MARNNQGSIPKFGQPNPHFKAEDYLYGRVVLPPWCYDQDHRQFPFIYANDRSVANGATSELDIILDADAHFLVEGIEIVPSINGSYENAFIQIQDTTTNAPWSNTTINLRDFAGKGDNPKYLSDPVLVFPSGTLQIFITNNIGSTRQFYVALHGRKIYGLTVPEATFLMKRQWYQYALTLPTMTSGQVNQQSTLNILNESDFLIKKMYSTDIIQFVINTATAGSESAEIMMQLQDGNTNLNFFSKKLAARLVVGSQFDAYNSGGASFTNASGFALRKPIFIRRNGQIIGNFDNRSTTTATGLKLIFEGCRVFN